MLKDRYEGGNDGKFLARYPLGCVFRRSIDHVDDSSNPKSFTELPVWLKLCKSYCNDSSYAVIHS